MNVISQLRRFRWIWSGRLKIKKQIRKISGAGKIKIVLGAGTTHYDGWIATDLPHFNILEKKDWDFFFTNQKIDNLLAEHVLEHLTETEVEKVIHLSSQYLAPGGIFRIAVPDSNHIHPTYLENILPPADGHQSTWTFGTFQKILLHEGYDADPLEYYTDDGIFKAKDFDFKNGVITRSKIKGYKNSVIPDYSSLIIDCIKK